MTIAALFDCDGTLYTAQMGRGLLRYLSEHGMDAAKRRAYASILPAHLLGKLKLISRETVSRAYSASLRHMVHGLTTEDAQAAFAWLAGEYLLPTQRPHVIARLREHQAQAHRVVLVSAGLTPILAEIARRLDVTDWIGTPIEVQNGRYTGSLTGELMVGAAKATGAQAHFAAQGIAIDWAASAAYGDSLHDRWMLAQTGNPVAVHPDDGLRRLAADQGWAVLEG
jgi:HAD superfamily hydrolase (TIGR01490 family)